MSGCFWMSCNVIPQRHLFSQESDMSSPQLPPLRRDSKWFFYQTDHELAKSRVKFERFLLPLIEKLDVKRLLEVGCGSGILPALLRDHGYDAHGIDPDFDLETSNYYSFLKHGTGLQLPYRDSEFEFTYALEVIEHVGTID